MLVEEDKDIEKAYEILQTMSQSREKRMAYEARQAEIMDQRTREKLAREQGIEQGIEKVAKAMLANGMDIEQISKITGLTKEEVLSL